MPTKDCGSGSWIQDQNQVGSHQQALFHQGHGAECIGHVKGSLSGISPCSRSQATGLALPTFQGNHSENKEIHEKWQWYFAHGKQANMQKEQLPVRALHPKSIVLDIGPEANARIIGPDGKLVSLVVHNLCPSKEAMAWADAAHQEKHFFSQGSRSNSHILKVDQANAHQY